MNYKKFLRAASAALMMVIVITLALTSGASAQGKFKTLYTFTGGKDGGGPQSALIFDQAGNLYGTAAGGGAYGGGTVFKLTPNPDGSWSQSVLYSFCSLTKCSDGSAPWANVIFDQVGNLYGTTFYGGNEDCWGGCGVVFQLAPNLDGSWKETVIHSFHSGDGGNPYTGLVFDETGNLYGTTQTNGAHGWGSVFQLTRNPDGSWNEKVLHQFTGGKDGGGPQSGLILDTSGNLYGTTGWGGRSDCVECGVVFELSPNAEGRWNEKVLHQFTAGKDGGGPIGGLIFDGAGSLYGATTFYGDSECGSGCGVVFELTPNSDGTWKEKMLHRFTGGKDGASPLAGLIFDQNWNLYGTTWLGGDINLCTGGPGCGVVFKLAPNSNAGWTETVLHHFGDHPGAWPQAGLIFDTSGNLYGTTYGDGSTTFGSVFEITP